MLRGLVRISSGGSVSQMGAARGFGGDVSGFLQNRRQSEELGVPAHLLAKVLVAPFCHSFSGGLAEVTTQVIVERLLHERRRFGWRNVSFRKLFANQVSGVDIVWDLYRETKCKIEGADNFPGQLHVRGLVFAHRDEQILLRFAVHYDVGGLEEGVAEEAVGAQVAAF